MALGRTSQRSDTREQKPNSGWLKENTEKRSAKSPDYRGVANVDGRDYWVSLWDKGKGLSVAFERKDEQRRESYQRSRENYRDDYRDGPPRGPNQGYRPEMRGDEPPEWEPDGR